MTCNILTQCWNEAMVLRHRRGEELISICHWWTWLDGAAIVGWLGGYFFEGFEPCGLSALPRFVHPVIYMGAVLRSRDSDNEDASS